MGNHEIPALEILDHCTSSSSTLFSGATC